LRPILEEYIDDSAEEFGVDPELASGPGVDDERDHDVLDSGDADTVRKETSYILSVESIPVDIEALEFFFFFRPRI
jgi:hypothetical protein